MESTEPTMPQLDDFEAANIVEKMREISDDAAELVNLLISDHECFTRGGNGRIKKTEIVSKLGWSSRKLEEVLEQCKKFLGDQFGG